MLEKKDLSNTTLMNYFRNKENDSTNKTIKMLVIGAVIASVVGSIATWTIWTTKNISKIEYLEKDLTATRQTLKETNEELELQTHRLTALREAFINHRH